MLVNKIAGTAENDKTKAAMFAALGIESRYQQPGWPLPNMKLSSEKDFWGWRASYSFSMEIWVGQMKIDNEWANLLLYWVGHSRFIGGGFAVAVFREYQKERVKYYEWRACDHTFKHTTIGNCLTRSTCSKCGEYFDTDSSG